MTLAIESGGTLSGTTIVSSGTTLALFGGAIATGSAIIQSGGTLDLAFGYTTSNYAIGSGVTVVAGFNGLASQQRDRGRRPAAGAAGRQRSLARSPAAAPS